MGASWLLPFVALLFRKGGGVASASQKVKIA
jgi:hypothetical protein